MVVAIQYKDLKRPPEDAQMTNQAVMNNPHATLTNAPLLPIGIPPQRMLTPEPRRERSLLEWVHDGVGRAEELLEDDPHSCV